MKSTTVLLSQLTMNLGTPENPTIASRWDAAFQIALKEHEDEAKALVASKTLSQLRTIAKSYPKDPEAARIFRGASFNDGLDRAYALELALYLCSSDYKEAIKTKLLELEKEMKDLRELAE